MSAAGSKFCSGWIASALSIRSFSKLFQQPLTAPPTAAASRRIKLFNDVSDVIASILAQRSSLSEKIIFGIGASIASFLFFFFIGYASKFLSKYAQNDYIWKYINITIIIFMSFLSLYVLKEILT